MEEERETISHHGLDADLHKKMLNPMMTMMRVMKENTEEMIKEIATSALSKCKYQHSRARMILRPTLNGNLK